MKILSPLWAMASSSLIFLMQLASSNPTRDWHTVKSAWVFFSLAFTHTGSNLSFPPKHCRFSVPEESKAAPEHHGVTSMLHCRQGLLYSMCCILPPPAFTAPQNRILKHIRNINTFMQFWAYCHQLFLHFWVRCIVRLQAWRPSAFKMLCTM